MARKRRRGPDTAPARNDVYVMMLLLTIVVTAVGSGLLAMECDEYGWESEPTAGPAVVIPEIPIGRPVTADSPAATDISLGDGIRPGVTGPLTRPADLTGVAPAVPPVLPALSGTVPVMATAEPVGVR